MLKIIPATIISLLISLFGFSQKENPVAQFDKKISHNVGVQANLLLQQFIPNSGNSNALNNPFWWKYALRFNQSNLEVTFGGGYSENQTKDGDLKTSQFNLPLRLGAAKKYYLGKRFEAGAGLDLVAVFDQSSSETENINNGVGFSSSTKAETSRKVNSFGGGPQVTLAYYINKNIRIGTEATGYFLYNEEHNTRFIQTYSSGFLTEEIDESDSVFSNNFQFTLPVALFLMVRF